MNELGITLKALRNEQHLSLKTVFKDTGVSDSKLSKIERGKCECTLKDLFTLIKYYDVSSINCLMNCGLITNDDVNSYCQIFDEADKLTDNDKKLVQSLIYRLTQKEV